MWPCCTAIWRERRAGASRGLADPDRSNAVRPGPGRPQRPTGAPARWPPGDIFEAKKPAHQLARLLALRSGFPLALTGA